jgi:hypothetical protein
MKTGVITKTHITGEWINPSGKTVYYHQLTIDNGDIGSIGVMERYPNKISTGTFIQYTIDDKQKIKILNDTNTLFQNTAPMPNKQYSTQRKAFTPSAKLPSDFLGFTWGYAKDLVIAGKTMQDVEELNKIARYIYEQVKDMLASDSPKE